MADEASFEEAFDDLFVRSSRLARRLLGDDAAAEDVAAEALARAYARWPRIAGRAWRDGWVLRVTTNLAIDASRRPKPRAGTDRPAMDVEDAVAVRLALVAALRALPRRQRESVVLRYLVGLSEAEVATTLRVSGGTVKTHLHRGTAALRSKLGPTFREDSLANH